MRKQYFTPLLCHYAECTIYPQRCYDKQPSSLFGRYNLPFVIRFNIELRPLPPPHLRHFRCYPKMMGMMRMRMRMLMSLTLHHSSVPTSLSRAKFGHTLPGNDLYPVYVWICTFLENGFLHLWRHGFAQTWYMRICARLLIQKLESNQSKSTNCSKFRPCEHETAIFAAQSQLSLRVSQTLK